MTDLEYFASRKLKPGFWWQKVSAKRPCDNKWTLFKHLELPEARLGEPVGCVYQNDAGFWVISPDPNLRYQFLGVAVDEVEKLVGASQ